jgi:hypothetical protein
MNHALSLILNTRPNLIRGSASLTVSGAATATEDPPGTITLTGDGTNSAIADYQVATTPGRKYRLAHASIGGVANVRIGTALGGSQLLGVTAMPNGASSIDVVATTTATWVRYNRQLAGAAVITNIALR